MPAWPDSGTQIEPDPRPTSSVTIDQGESGSVIVMWAYPYPDDRIRAQRFRNGEALWADSGVVLTRQLPSNGSHKSIADGRGGFYFAWSSRGNVPSLSDLYLAHVDSNGVHQWPADLPVCTSLFAQVGPSMLLLERGVQVFWRDYRQGGLQSAIYTQRIDADGTPSLATNGVNIMDDLNAGITHLVGDGAGGVYLLLVTHRLNLSVSDSYLTRVDSTGAIAPGWPVLGLLVSEIPNAPDLPKGVTLDPDGNVLVAWSDYRYAGIEGSGGAVWLQLFSPGGVRLWTAGDRVGIAGRGSFSSAGQAVPDGRGGFYLAYLSTRTAPEDSTVFRVQHADHEANPLWGPAGVTVAAATSQKNGGIIADGSGGGFASWLDDRFGPDRLAVFAQHVNADGSLGGGVTATQASAIESSYENGCAHLVWHTSESAGMRFQVERAREGEGYEPVGEAWPDGRGLVDVRDCGLERGESYRYRLAWDEGGTRAHSSPVIVQAQAASVLSFSPPFPTPATSRTELVFSLPRASRVRLAVHDLAGRRVALILDEARGAGTHRRTWEPRDSAGRLLPPGAYTLTLSAAGETRSRRLIVVR